VSPEVALRLSEAAPSQPSETRSAAAAPETPEPVRTSLPLAAQEVHVLPLETPKPAATTEILLHLTGNDQSSAAIRVADRAGSVNISVHATDPDLRNSLRSNLGELSSQLNTQGWKTEVAKPATFVAHSETAHDSRSGEQRSSSQQQQSNGEDRQQPQRDRRTNQGRWQDEFEQVSAKDVTPGGKQ
jgi:hypothetical protein